MQIIYKTIDGREFTNEQDAAKHEQSILSDVLIFDWNGNRTWETNKAMVVVLRTEGAAETFIDMAHAQGDSVNGIVPEDSGIFYYNEFGNVYEYIHDDAVLALSAAWAVITKEEN